MPRPAVSPTPILVAALAIALYSAMDAVMKGLSLALGVYNALFWRALIALGVSGLLYGLLAPPPPTPATVRLHLWRGAVTTVMAIAFFWGIARLPLAEAIALTFVAPLIALYLAAAVLKERVGRSAVIGSLIGFAGVLVLVAARAGAPRGEEGLAGAAAVLVSALLYAYNIVLMRQQALVANPVEITFYQSLSISALLALAAPWFAVVPPDDQVPPVLLGTALGLASALMLAWAYRRAEAQYLAPVEYTAIVWAAGFGFAIFGEEAAAATLIGAALIVAGCWWASRGGRAPVPQVEAVA